MTEDLELQCRCGEIQGWARGASPTAVSRSVCYCDDCQAFMHYLGRADLLDAHGGTDVVQVPPNMVSWDRGLERIVGMRLSEKGLYRWYASCCKTPLGNTMLPSIPFIGMPLEVFRGAQDSARVNEVFGEPRGRVMGKFAVGGPPAGSTAFPLGLVVHAVVKVLGWKFKGKAWPHPYFDEVTRAPKYPVIVLQPSERDALRPRCGPNPVPAALA